jgi:hypothetical protein
MSNTEALAGQSEDGARSGGQRQEQGRVVLRGVQVIVLDDLPAETRRKICDAAAMRPAETPWPQCEAWITEALQPGSFDAAIVAHAGESGEQGNRPGRYRAVKKAAWFEKGPRNIEPPLT